ncbi:MAG: uracil-DNA glycosylase [Sulfuritalea sp.]|nr:uracil-DNA glycosylase [Sulfuritalea sp.]
MTQDEILREMGLGPVWKLRATAAAVPAAEPLAPAAPEPQLESQLEPTPAVAAAQAGLSWEELAAAVVACRACRLCEARKQAVLGVGDRHADWLFVGEGPGAEEDQRGEPFVGQAGKLLDNMLAAIGLKRGEDVYIANAVKCRPPENRTPTSEETATCRPYLERQIELIQPKLIVALGRPAAQTLLQSEVKIGAARGRLHDYRGIPLIVTYHPAYLLRTLQDKAKAWEDLCFMRRTMKTLKGN